MPIFQKPHFYYDCDRCRATFDPRKGGVCSVCKDMLCGRDLYGSMVEQLLVYFGKPMVCVRCRAEGRSATSAAGGAR